MPQSVYTFPSLQIFSSAMTSEGTTRSRKVLDCQVVEYVCTMIEGDLSEGVFRVPGNVRVADQLLSTFGYFEIRIFSPFPNNLPI